MEELDEILGDEISEGLKDKLYDIGRAVLGKSCMGIEGRFNRKNKAEILVGYRISSLRSGTVSRAARGLLRSRVNSVLRKYNLRLYELYRNRSLVDDGLRIGPDPLKKPTDYGSYS